MFKLYCAALVALLSFPAVAQDYQATTTTTAVLRYGPGAQYEQTGTIPAGTRVAVDVCFNKGEYCLVKWGGDPVDGFIAGELMIVEGTNQTVLAAEKEKWARIAARKPDSLVYRAPIAMREIRTEGDSYMAGAYDIVLSDMIKANLGVPVTNTAKGGASLDEEVARMAAPSNVRGAVTVFWDGSTNGATSPETYVEKLADGIAALGHDRFLVILPALPGEAPAGTQDKIGDLIKKRWPDNYLDWRPIIPNNAGRINDDQFAKYPEDQVHLGEAPLRAIADAVKRFIDAKGWLG